MNSMFVFNPDEKRTRMAQALENYVLPEQKINVPQMPTANSFSAMDVIKMMGKKKPDTTSPIDTWQGGPQ